MQAVPKPRGTGLGTRNVGLERELTRALEGEVHFDPFTRGRYATDASIYQMMPTGVVMPRHEEDMCAILAIAAKWAEPVIMRGAGTSQNGQPIGHGLVVDCSRHWNGVGPLDAAAGTITVQPGAVLDHVNRGLRSRGWFFPVEPSTATRCTFGGMVGNNSSGARSLRYGKTVDNVVAIRALLADGEPVTLDAAPPVEPRGRALWDGMLGLAEREKSEIDAMFPRVQRRVGGYNLDALLAPTPNLAHLLVGSEGTLAVTTGVTLRLTRLPPLRVLGLCQFPSFQSAMEMTARLVALDPTAVELVDNNILTLGADIPLFRNTLAEAIRGTPDCLLIVEFSEDDQTGLDRAMRRLDQCMADHGLPDSVVQVAEPARQRAVWEVREACLNIMMSMRGDEKPVSFIEDCAVPLDRLAEYTAAMTEVFARHGTRGTWYAHASVGCLHVRPVLDMKTGAGVATMRRIADEASALVRQMKGSFSGEHGDGISRSEYIEPMFGWRLMRAFEEVKRTFDPDGRLNPGKITRPYRMDDRALMRFAPDYPDAGRVDAAAAPALDWGREHGFLAAVEMCNNNGTCRKTSGGAMCPSYRVTRDETHVTRGRANTLRLALTGQLGPDAFASGEMMEALDLCVSCKSCRRECPTGVDMAKMKIEVLRAYHAAHGLPLKERLVAGLPAYAPFVSVLPGLANFVSGLPFARGVMERVAGFSARRSLPRWNRPWRPRGRPAGVADVVGDGRDLVLFGDTFNRYFEAANLRSAERVLGAAGYRLHAVAASGRPLCCGRTYLSAGRVDAARREAARTAAALAPFVAAGARVVGLEPSCLLTFRDEFASLLGPERSEGLAASSLLLEELLVADRAMDRLRPRLRDQGGRTAHLHGHCHQKAFDAFDCVAEVLGQVPGLRVEAIESSCCGMAGAFGYDRRHFETSFAMAELSLFPALRKASAGDLIVADGVSCRHQIADGLSLDARHVVTVLDEAIGPDVREGP